MFQVSRDAAHDPLRGALALDKNDHVIGVAREIGGPALRGAQVAGFKMLTVTLP